MSGSGVLSLLGSGVYCANENCMGSPVEFSHVRQLQSLANTSLHSDRGCLFLWKRCHSMVLASTLSTKYQTIKIFEWRAYYCSRPREINLAFSYYLFIREQSRRIIGFHRTSNHKLLLYQTRACSKQLLPQCLIHSWVLTMLSQLHCFCKYHGEGTFSVYLYIQKWNARCPVALHNTVRIVSSYEHGEDDRY